MNALVPLGTNGWFPSGGRGTASYLLLADGAACLLDAGTGVARLAEPRVRELLRDVPCLDVFLSHYHLDHVAGLTYLSGVWDRAVRIWAPAPPLVAGDPDAALATLLGPPFGTRGLAGWPIPVEVKKLDSDGARVGALDVAVRAQTHPGGSVGLRFGDRVAYLTDTVVDEKSGRFARGVRLLLHEVWAGDGEAERAEARSYGHSHASGVAAIAAEARPATLLPIHHHPKRSEDELAALAYGMEREAGVPVVLPREGVVYGLGDAD